MIADGRSVGKQTGIEIVTSATRRGGDTVHAGRILARALVVIGGAAAVSAIVWLTATASASTVTQVTDGPIGSGTQAVVTTAGDAQSPMLAQVTGSVPLVRRAHDAATPTLARVRDLSGAAAQTGRLADVLETSVTHAAASVPATVLAVGRIAVTATDLTGLAAQADAPRDHVEQSPLGPDVVGRNDATRAPADSGTRERSAGLSPVAIPVRAATTAIAGQAHADHGSDHGATGRGRSWLPSCVVPANAGLSAGHDRGCGDAVQPPAADHPQPSHRRNDVLRRAVTAAEIQPGITPD
ncbi:hypothetical protein [Amycolatopsis sp. NPDC051371]|uniref:hypothetical protein n=1 Tax=Amycolatopsis sp. NPDC051371 TaxID=3155800 RepID=UPI0034122417